MSGRRDRGGGGGHGESGEERWLLPYADMITLLLGLFIVLFAMSSLDAKKFDNLRSSLAQTFNGGQVLTEPGKVLPGSSGVMNPSSTSDAPTEQAIQRLAAADAASKADYERQAKEITQVAKEAGLGNDLRVTTNQRGIVVNLAGDALFESGSSELRPGIKERLARLELKLQRLGRTIEIAGHTDGAPYGYPGGNWELSADRAMAVVLFFEAKGYPRNLMIPQFHADTKPAVAPPKGNPQADMRANRRIEITILLPGALDPRPQELQLVDAATPAGAAKPGVGKPNPIGKDLQKDFAIVQELAQTAREAG